MKLHVCNQAWIVFIVLSLFASPLYIGHVLTPAAREQIRELLLHVSCIEAIQLDRLFHAAFCHIAEGARVRSQRPVSVTSGSVSMRQSACLLLAPIDRKCAWQHHDLGHARLCHCRLWPGIDAPGHRQCPFQSSAHVSITHQISQRLLLEFHLLRGLTLEVLGLLL